MPCFNAAPYLTKSLSSALGQTFKEIELIVVDDGSTDSSLQVLEGIRDPRLKIISQPNRGVCAARNRGLSEALGEHIAFLDADDAWHRECLTKLYAALRSHPGSVLAYCGWQNVGIEGRRGEPFVPPDYERLDKAEIFLGGCRWPVHAALTRRSAIEQAGGFDERFPTSEDYYLWLKIATRHPIVLVPEVLAYYHFHEGCQATRDRLRTAFNHLLVQQEFLREQPGIIRELGHSRIRELTYGELLKRGYICYWDRDLAASRKIFRQLIKAGYGSLKDWKYMLPALLPSGLHRALIRSFGKSHKDS
ncbi:MAG: glycosyltransferase [Deltaproteobacteria bacterium]|nr:glycosyltransferase [Deltaproteobacteria bacterium]